MIKKLIVLAMLAIPTTAIAGPTFETGRSLLEFCNGPSLSHHWYCLGYVTAMADMHIAREQLCPPVGVVKDDIKRIVTAYLEGNPVTLNETASDGVLYALVDAYPCE